MPSKFGFSGLKSLLRNAAGAASAASFDYLSVKDDWSTVTPGPIVELTDTFCR